MGFFTPKNGDQLIHWFDLYLCTRKYGIGVNYGIRVLTFEVVRAMLLCLWVSVRVITRE